MSNLRIRHLTAASVSRSNALKMDVYFKELDYEEIVTEPSYEVRIHRFASHVV